MRVRVQVDQAVLAEAMRLAGSTSKRAIVEQALRFLSDRASADEKLASYRDRLKRVQAGTDGLRFEESAAELVRKAREAGSQ